MDKFLNTRIMHFGRSFLTDPLAHWPFTEIVRLCFGNTAGVRQNIYGVFHAAVRRVTGRRSIGLLATPEIEGLVRRLKKDGLVLIDRMLPEETLRRVATAIGRLNDCQGPLNGYIRVLGPKDIERYAPETFEVFTRDVQTLVEEYFNSCFTVDDILVRITDYAPPEVVSESEVYSDEWHCDSAPTSELGMFVLLHDTSEEDGPTHAISKLETRQLVRRYYKSRNRQDVDRFRPRLEEAKSHVKFIGSKGSVLFVETTRCLHRASIPMPGHKRIVLMIRLLPSGNPTDLTKIVKSPVFDWTHGKKKKR